MTKWEKFWHKVAGCDWKLQPIKYNEDDDLLLKLLTIFSSKPVYKCTNPKCGKERGSYY